MRVQTTRRPASLARSSSAGASLRRARRRLNIGSEEAVLPRPPLLFLGLKAISPPDRYLDGPDSLPIPPVARPESLSTNGAVSSIEAAPFASTGGCAGG